MLRTLMLPLLPAVVLLAFRTLCTLKPAPVPTYLEEKGRCGCPGHDRR